MKPAETKKKSNKAVIAGILLVVLLAAGFTGWLIWYCNADPTVKLCDYKNLKIDTDLSQLASGSVAAPGGIAMGITAEERVNQAVLSALVENSKFHHLNQTVEERYEQFMAYYGQIVALYDEYSTVEELAIKYYGYESYDAFSDAVKEYSEIAVKQELVLGAIAEKEGFVVTDEIFNRYIPKYLAAYNYGEDEVEAFLENYGKADVYAVILNDYTLDRVTEWAGLGN